MAPKYLAFDIETAKILPQDAGELLSHRPLGITCTATLSQDSGKVDLFFSTTANGSYAPQMTRDDLSRFVDFLLAQVEAGYTIVTLNGAGFDFDILAEESGRLMDCRKLAWGHVDMMFHVLCEKGFGVGLKAAAKVIGLDKPADVDGSVAPQLWKDGEQKRVLEYISQDCSITLAVAMESERQRAFRWLTKRGTTGTVSLPKGWLRVKEAAALPLPDTSWMDSPWPRSKFTGWMQ